MITRTYMAGALLTTAACALELLSPYSLYFSLPLIVGRHQYWRLVTNFFFFGRNFTLDFLFHMFFLSEQADICHTARPHSFTSITHSLSNSLPPSLPLHCVYLSLVVQCSLLSRVGGGIVSRSHGGFLLPHPFRSNSHDCTTLTDSLTHTHSHVATPTLPLVFTPTTLPPLV